MTENAPVFVLGFYRGGTTLLQRLLNCFRDLAVWGEHSGFLRDFAKAYGAIRTSDLKKVDAADYVEFKAYAKRFIPWDNGFDANEFLAWQRSSICRLFDIPPTVRWGFKEVRYNDIGMMRYLTELYPECRILFLTRNPEDILISRLLVRWETRFREAAEIERYCRDFEMEWRTAFEAAEYLRRTTRNLMFVKHEALLENRRFPDGLCKFLQLDPQTLDERLFDAALNTRAGSSHGDVRNRRLARKEVSLRIDCVREWIASSAALRGNGKGAQEHASGPSVGTQEYGTLTVDPVHPA